MIYFCFLTSREIIENHANDPSSYDDVLDWSYRKVVRITESVLFIKQHSVNCISTALFLLTTMHQRLGRDDVRKFVYKLFEQESERVNNVETVRRCIFEFYEELLNRRKKNEYTAGETILDYLLTDVGLVSGMLPNPSE